MEKRDRRTFTPEFKKQMVQLHENGKSRQAIATEYELNKSSLNRWVLQYRQSGSFKEKDNRSIEQQELLSLHKELKQLRMENDILKQAALIQAAESKCHQAK